jgi:hypothetical protein
MGAQGANGEVVLITTKWAKKGSAPTITLIHTEVFRR